MPNQPTYDQPIIHPDLPGIDLQNNVWFDRDGDWPHYLRAVEAEIAENPDLADGFHFMGHPALTYRRLLPERLSFFT